MRYEAVTDADALQRLSRARPARGDHPGAGAAHAIAWLLAETRSARDPSAPGRGAEEGDGFDVLTLSGRGDKDLAEVVERLGDG